MVVSWEKFSNRIDPSLNKNKHFELSSEKDTFVKKESDFYSKRKKKCMLQFYYCNSFRPRSGHTPNEFAFIMIWLTSQRIDWYFSKITNQIQDNITFQMPKRRKLTGI